MIRFNLVENSPYISYWEQKIAPENIQTNYYYRKNKLPQTFSLSNEMNLRRRWSQIRDSILGCMRAIVKP